MVVKRRDRLVAHILKYHVPLDRAPYSCSLCLFKATDWKKLQRHIDDYPPHKSMAEKRGIIDNTPFLSASASPYQISARDMEEVPEDDAASVMSRELSPTSAEQPRDTTAAAADSQVPASRGALISTLAQPLLTTTPAATVTNPTIGWLLDQTTAPCQQVQTAELWGAVDPNLLQPIQVGVTATTQEAATPAVVSQSSTPLRDETIFRQVMPGASDLQDPLQTEEDGAQAAKRTRAEGTPMEGAANLLSTAISAAIDSASSKIAEALDRNTRAVRCQEATLSKVVEELVWMRRAIDRNRPHVPPPKPSPHKRRHQN